MLSCTLERKARDLQELRVVSMGHMENQEQQCVFGFFFRNAFASIVKDDHEGITEKIA